MVNPWIYLWWFSLAVSVIAFGYAVWKTSAGWMLVSLVTILPLAHYFSGANNWLQSLAALPLVHAGLAVCFWWKRYRRASARQTRGDRWKSRKEN